MYVVTVHFTVHAEHADAFRVAMLDNAAASLREEPGCHYFDVCEDPAVPGSIFLYELYDDRAAFEAHLATPHFNAFNDGTAHMVADKQAAMFERLGVDA